MAGKMNAAAALVFPTATADPALLARVLASSRVERRPQSPDASYLRDLAAGFFRALGELAASASQRLRLPPWLLVAAVALLAGMALALLARAWWRRRRHRRDAAGGSGEIMAGESGVEVSAVGARRAEDEGWDAAAWRLELERRLAQEKIPEALRAAWWWLARSLAGTAAEPTWTGRELLRWSRRDDLGALLRQLEAMAYGPRPPGTAEVRRLAARLQEALA